MSKTIQAGDKILFHGKMLDIMEVSDATGVNLASVGEKAMFDQRTLAKEKIDALRAEQVIESEKVLTEKLRDNTDRWKQLKDEIDALSKSVIPLGIVKLRVDLLEWWEAKQCWIAPGRVLSDEQKSLAKLPRKAGGLGLAGDFDHRYAILALEGKI